VDRSELPVSRFECNHGPALRMAALQGFGLVMQPRILLQADLEAGRLVEVLAGFVPPPMPVHLIYPRDRQQPPKLRSFIDFVVQRFGHSLCGAPPAQAEPAGRRRGKPV
jgi:DNA-binding transcriptional LysR family regulator